MVHLKRVEVSEKLARELHPCLPIARLPDPGKHVQERIEPGASIEAYEVVPTHSQVAPISAKQIDKPIESTVFSSIASRSWLRTVSVDPV